MLAKTLGLLTASFRMAFSEEEYPETQATLTVE